MNAPYNEIFRALLSRFVHEATAKKVRRDAAVAKAGIASNACGMLKERVPALCEYLRRGLVNTSTHLSRPGTRIPT